MKSAILPAVCIEPALRSDAESVLDDSETLSDFIADCVRSGVARRRTQDAFLARAQDAVERGVRNGDDGISPDELLKLMDDRLNAAQSLLSAGAAPHKDNES